MLENVSYRRGLDGKVVAKWQTPGGGRDRRWLSSAETIQLQETGHSLAEALLQDHAAGILRLSPDLDAQARVVLARAAEMDAAAYQNDLAAYAGVYQPVGILPPDQYMAVVLQVAQGCSFNTCTFCTFYKDRPFRILAPAAFRAHVRGVKNFLGDGLSLRRTVFLGDANALVIPTPRLMPLLDIVNQELDVEKLGGIYAFLDGFSGEKKNLTDYQRLRSAGLERVYIGLESGHDPLLRFLKKPGKAEDAVQAVHAMKEAGVSVGVIVLLGAGGQAYARSHVEDSIATLNRMNLDADDLIYFSELVEAEGMQYTLDAYQAGLGPLSAGERAAQAEEIETALVFDDQRGTPHISRYDIREFVY